MRRHKPTEEEGRESLVAHAAEKGCEARRAHGGFLAGLSMTALETLLEDRKFVRHPVRLHYGIEGLQEGEFAHAEAVSGDDPSEGFVIHVHPVFIGQEDVIPLLVAYQLVTVNYGEIAGPEAAEAFGAALCGLEIEEYYQTLCQIADSLGSSHE